MMAGSTAEVANVVSEQIAVSGLKGDVLPVRKVSDLGNYNAWLLEIRLSWAGIGRP